MKDNNNLKVGDALRCIYNDGLRSVGSVIEIKGLTKSSINISGSKTGWVSRGKFRWECYTLSA